MALVTNVVNGSEARGCCCSHGYGADERDLGGLLPYLDPDGAFADGAAAGAARGARVRPGSAWYEHVGGDGVAGRVRRRARRARRRCSTSSARRSASRAARRSSAGSRRAPGSRSALALQRSERPRPGRRARDEPARSRLGGARARRRGRRRPGARAARHQRPADPGAAIARPRARSCASSACRPCTASTRWSTRSRSRACRTHATWLATVLAGERPDEPVPEDPVELVPSVTTAQFEAEVLESEHPGDRRLLGAVVRAVPAGVADRRDDRRDARGLLQGREGQHRRRTEARAGVRRAEHPDDRPVPQRPPRAASVGAKPRPQLEAELGMLVIP